MQVKIIILYFRKKIKIIDVMRYIYRIKKIDKNLLNIYFKDDNCKIKGMRIQIKGRYMLTKRKRIFIFNFGNLNLNKIDLNKDYFSLNLIKSTGASSIKIWISYK